MDPSRKISQDVESINTLDTAKMTLRWALGRLRLIEQRNSSLEKEVEKAQSALLAKSKASHDEETFQVDRRDYYKKLEALLGDYCKGTLNLQALLARESELDAKERELHQNRSTFEQEITERREALERRFKKLQVELEIQANRQAEGLETVLEDRKKQLDKSYLDREMALRSTDHQMDLREKAIAELEKRRKELHEEYEKSLERRIAQWQEERDEQDRIDELQSNAEKKNLKDLAARWEEQARRHLANIEELEEEKAKSQEHVLAQSLDAEKRVDAARREHEKKIQSIAAMHEDRRKEMEAVEQERRKQNASEVSDLKQQVDAGEQRIRLLTEELSRMNLQNEALRTRLDSLDGDSRTLDERFKQERAKTDTWRQKADEARQEADTLKERILRESAKSNHENAGRLQALFADFQDKEKELEATFRKREEELQTAHTRQISELHGKMNALKEELGTQANADEQVRILKDNLQKERAAIVRLREEAEHLRAEDTRKISDLAKKTEAQLRIIQDREAEMAQERARTEDLEARLEKSRVRIQTLEENAVHEKERAETFKGDMEATREELRGEYRIKENTLRAQHGAALVEMEKKLEELRKRIYQGEVSLTSERKAAETARSLLEDSQARVAALGNAHEDLRKQILALTAELEDKENKFSRQHMESKEQENKIRALTTHAQHLQEKLNDTTAEAEKLREASSIRQEEFQKQKNDLRTSLREEFSARQAELQQKQENLSQRILAKEEAAAVLKQENEGLTKRIAAYQDRVESLEIALEQNIRTAIKTGSFPLAPTGAEDLSDIGQFVKGMYEKDRALEAVWVKRCAEIEAAFQEKQAEAEKAHQARIDEINETLKEEMAGAQEMAQALEAEKQKHEFVQVSLQGELAKELEKAQADANARIQKSETEISELNKKLTAATEELKRREEGLHSQEARNKEFSKRTQAFADKAEKLERELAVARDDIEELRKTAEKKHGDAVKQSLQREEEVRSEHSKRIADLQHRLESSMKSAEETEVKLREEHTERVSEMQKTFEATLQKLQDREEALAAVVTRSEESSKRLQSAQERIRQLENDLEETRARANKQAQIQTDELKKQGARLEKIRDEQQRLHTQEELLKEQQASLSSEREKVAAQAEELRRSREQLAQYRRALAAKWEEKRGALALLKSKMLKDIEEALRKAKQKGGEK